MIVIDESAALRLCAGTLAGGESDGAFVLPASRHWRLLLGLHSRPAARGDDPVASLAAPARAALRFPGAHVFGVLDPRPLLDRAAALAVRHAPCPLPVAETVAAALHYAAPLGFGDPRNVDPRLVAIAAELRIPVHVLP